MTRMELPVARAGSLNTAHCLANGTHCDLAALTEDSGARMRRGLFRPATKSGLTAAVAEEGHAAADSNQVQVRDADAACARTCSVGGLVPMRPLSGALLGLPGQRLDGG